MTDEMDERVERIKGARDIILLFVNGLPFTEGMTVLSSLAAELAVKHDLTREQFLQGMIGSYDVRSRNSRN